MLTTIDLMVNKLSIKFAHLPHHKNQAMKDNIQAHEISSILEKELANFNNPSTLEEVGTVLEVGDGVALVYGLNNVQASELVEFERGQKGLALNLEKDHVGVVILDHPNSVKEGDQVKRTKKISSVKVGEGLVGRIINTLGEPLDGQGKIKGALFDVALERKAPDVIYREPVAKPLQTGLKTIDTMIPIGRGQRQLIIGDRQTGKTTIAVDTILNQRKNFEQGEPVYCIYVAIGQKASTVANVVATLKKHGAMAYTTVVLSSASAPAPLQFLAPFTGVAIGEYFRDTGRHALVVFDDLSKQAVFYREISLLLKRLPGREAYPGDIFYLHARLLERGAKINRNDKIARQMNDIPPSIKDKVKGGGSLTALPIIESQEGDVSAYIPTNVISITDGQLFLETSLFNAGVRPAINIGISVSRVGGAAQLRVMKKVAGKLKLEQSQFLEMEGFAKLGGDIDPTTKKIITRGQKNRRLLTQPPHQPMPVEHQVALAYASVNGFLDEIPIDKVEDFSQDYLQYLMHHHAKLLKDITRDILTEESKKILDQTATKAGEAYQSAR